MIESRSRWRKLSLVLAAAVLAAGVPSVCPAQPSDAPGVVRKKLPAAPEAEVVRKKLPEPPPAAAAESSPAAAAETPPPPAAAAQTPAPAEAPPPAPAPPPPAREPARPAAAKTAAKPYSILLASHRQRENALVELAHYRGSGLAPFLTLTDLPGKGAWWRTLCGGYASLAEALEARKRLNIPAAVVVKTPFANLVGEYPSERDAAKPAARLTEIGFQPYSLPAAGGGVALFVGAYPDRQGAERDRLALKEKGIETRVVPR
jgi:cell division septation protein DedD